METSNLDIRLAVEAPLNLSQIDHTPFYWYTLSLSLVLGFFFSAPAQFVLLSSNYLRFNSYLLELNDYF